MTAATGLMRHDQVTDLVTRAQHGDQRAWGALVERYAPLIWSICRRYRLGLADADDVAQYVWLTLVGQLGNIRDPAALPGWLATTAARECAKTRCAAQRPPAAGQIPQADSIPDTPAAAVEQELQQAERRAALREAFTCLPPGYRRLLALLIQDPPANWVINTGYVATANAGQPGISLWVSFLPTVVSGNFPAPDLHIDQLAVRLDLAFDGTVAPSCTADAWVKVGTEISVSGQVQNQVTDTISGHMPEASVLRPYIDQFFGRLLRLPAPVTINGYRTDGFSLFVDYAIPEEPPIGPPVGVIRQGAPS